ncbi:MAG: response regulator [Taibaiella sp.]|nr:response regulator [Taibaiella sp.]
MNFKQFLLVDDDRDDRELFCEALEDLDKEISCHTAAGADEAMELLAALQPGKPDVIFMDINMPLVSGWECLTLLKKHDLYRDIPVIIYSTSSHTRDIEIAKNLGAYRFITKPHDYKLLLRVLTELLTADHN